MLWRQANEQPERLGQEFEAGSRQLRSVGSTTEGGGTWDGECLAAGGPGGERMLRPRAGRNGDAGRRRRESGGPWPVPVGGWVGHLAHRCRVTGGCVGG